MRPALICVKDLSTSSETSVAYARAEIWSSPTQQPFFGSGARCEMADEVLLARQRHADSSYAYAHSAQDCHPGACKSCKIILSGTGPRAFVPAL